MAKKMPSWFGPALAISGILAALSGLSLFRRKNPQ